MDKLKNLIKSDTPTEESTRHSEPVSHGTSGYPDTSSTAQSGTGVAAVGDTSTYSSSQLGRGDPTSSVIDSQSRDPLTYTKPESSNLASMPGHENPYRASSLDPRVDGGRKSDAPIISRPAETQEYGVSSHRGSSGTSTAPAPSSLTSTANPIDRSAEYGQSTSTHGLDNASSVTGTSSHPTASSTGPTSSTGTTGTTHTTEQPSVIGSALGAVGLGGLASSLGYGASQPEHTSTTSQPTTTTGVDSYTAPTHQGPSGHYRRESIPTSAYPAGVDSPRAINAPVGGTRASIDQGVQQTTSHSHSGTGVGAGVGAAALGSGIGLGREQERAQATRENITGEVPSTVSSSQHQGGSSAVPRDMYNESQTLRSNVVSGSGPTNTSSTLGHTSSTPGSTAHTSSGHSSGPTMVHNLITVGDDDVAPITSSGLRDPTVIGHGILHPEGSTGIPPYTSTRESGNLTSAPLSSTQESGKFTSTPLRDESHTGRNAALGGAAATAAGAGAYAAHEHRHGAGSSTTAPLSSTQESGKFTSTPLRDQGYASSATPLSGTTATTSVPSAQNTGKFTSAPLSGTQQSGKFTSTPLTGTQDSGKFTSTPIQEERHTGRDAALGGAAATAVGAGAYGAHQHKDQAEHQKELEKAEKAHQKEVEKEEKREQKELHKEEKAHQKELEKAHHHDEKAHQKELAAVGKRNEREEAKLEKDMEREKKPSIFKRIFKKRQNKETGAEEEYSTDEEDDHHHRGGVAGAGVVGGATGAAIAHDRSTTGRPTEPITGLPYDPSKDPSTARHLSEHSHGQGMARSVGATDTNDLREDRLIGGSGGNVIDPIAAGSFKMGVIEDGKHGSVSHDDRSGGYSTGTGTGTGVGSGIGSGVGTGAAAHGLGQQHDYSSTTGTAGTGSQTLPYRPTNAAPGDSTQHYTPNVGNEGRRLSTAETYGSPTTSNIRAPGNEPQHLAAQEMQHVHQTGEHETVGTQLKDSFKFGGL